MSRKLNSLERKLHQAALSAPLHTITQKELEHLGSDPAKRTAAINFLLGTGLFVLFKDEGSRISYRAVSQDDLEIKKGLSQEDMLVLNRIRAADNQGIWTKHIKSQTQLHQTIIDKCLKSLTQKQLIKTINDVRHTTRKIYMLAHIEPSVELTGGPWYTDKELDTEFIKLLSDVCFKIVRDSSFPIATEGDVSSNRPLYTLAHSSYPTATQILDLIKRSRVTETVLTVHHVEMLLEVLILDGKIEKVPAFRIPESTVDQDQYSDEDGQRLYNKKRRHRNHSDDSDSSIDTEADRRRRRRKRRREVTSDSEDSMSTIEDDQASHKRRRQRGSDEHGRSQRKQKGKGKSRNPSVACDIGSEAEPADGMYPVAQEDLGLYEEDLLMSGRFAYRAVREERVTLGLNQSPCIICPVSNFCRGGGPVNPQECNYYETWMAAGGALLE